MTEPETAPSQPAESTTETTAPQTGEGDFRRQHNYALVKYSDMNEEMLTEAMEISVTACEKFSANNENAAKMIKESMDKKFGPPWCVVVGEGFSFDISYTMKNITYLFFGGNLGICIWKCTT